MARGVRADPGGAAGLACVLIVVSLGVARLVQVGGDILIRRVTRRIDGKVDDIVLVGAYLAREPIGLSGALDVGVTATILSTITLVWMVTPLRVGRRASRELIESAEGVDGRSSPFSRTSGRSSSSASRVPPADLLGGRRHAVAGLGRCARHHRRARREGHHRELLGSIALYFDGTYKVGDYIVLETGERGRVEDISIRSTVVRTRDDIS